MGNYWVRLLLFYKEGRERLSEWGGGGLSRGTGQGGWLREWYSRERKHQVPRACSRSLSGMFEDGQVRVGGMVCHGLEELHE